ncbi:hypothetical protein RHGRI_031009 [Rhododendron griersonianum]|uniref:RING-type E3 ubiquitin transferase n=1 Tax=Rhododendron griersonianum TaxID=479676 RepID=A0AAV6IA09_9ERIC|nr:hypothetical protein RHGRI_031009 [Rhododendron griersonianum]
MTPDSVGNTPQTYSSPPVTIILTIVLLVLFFVGFFSIYFCRCFLENLIYAWYFRGNNAGTTVGPGCTDGRPGLDPLTINSFPTFTYSSVKDYRKEKYGLECAICLSEFVGDDVLRLLTPCCHVFHQECIDLWFELHKTCPVCRRSLDSVEESLQKSSALPTHYNSPMHEINEDEPLEDTFSITIKDDNDEDRGGQSEGGVLAANSATHTGDQQIGDGQKKMEKFSRSHSTGHSIVRRGEDRFTLRLPEHLHAKLVRGHNWTGSCTTFGEFKSKTSAGNGGFGEVSGFSGGDVRRV